VAESWNTLWALFFILRRFKGLQFLLFHRREPEKIKGRTAVTGSFFILSACLFANTFFLFAFTHTTIANAVLSHYTAPIL
jgi:drug/metabolite transporter (DMT)-like permease